jgi:hypothetical protein
MTEKRIGVYGLEKKCEYERRRKTEDMPGRLEEDNAGVAVELNKNNNEEENVSPMPYWHLEQSEYQREKKRS